MPPFPSVHAASSNLWNDGPPIHRPIHTTQSNVTHGRSTIHTPQSSVATTPRSIFSVPERAGDIYTEEDGSLTPASSATGLSELAYVQEPIAYARGGAVAIPDRLESIHQQDLMKQDGLRNMKAQNSNWLDNRWIDESNLANHTFYEIQPTNVYAKMDLGWNSECNAECADNQPDTYTKGLFGVATVTRGGPKAQDPAQAGLMAFPKLPDLDDPQIFGAFVSPFISSSVIRNQQMPSASQVNANNHLENSYDEFDFKDNTTCANLPVSCGRAQKYTPQHKLARHSMSAKRHQAAQTEDIKLAQLRDAGMPFRAIKEQAGFSVAESTLRGRYRNMKKDKGDRPRKPAWPEEAIQALIDGVEHFASERHTSMHTNSDHDLGKIPWKKVAAWMASERHTHLYGNATVKKKYVEVMRQRARNLITS